MDKIAANNHFVVLRKEIKKSKAMVAGNLVRKLNAHKQSKDRIDDSERIEKIDVKIERIFDDIKLLKKIDSFEIAKKATCKTDLEYWGKLINDSKAKNEDILTARVIVKSNIQKQVAKFRNDHKDCDEWLNEYIEYREKKKELLVSSKRLDRRRLSPEERGRRFVNNQQGAKKRNEKFDQYSDKKSSVPNRRKKLDKRTAEKWVNEEEKKKLGDSMQSESLHPSWESKRKEKELLKAAFNQLRN